MKVSFCNAKFACPISSDEEDNAGRILKLSISQSPRTDNQAFPSTIGEFLSQKHKIDESKIVLCVRV